MKYIDADRLKAEVEKRLQENADKALLFGAAFAGRTAEDNEIVNLINSLQEETPYKADRIRAEIERQIAFLPTVGYSTQVASEFIPVQNTLNYILSFIDSLQQEQPEVDIEEQDDDKCPICGWALDAEGCCGCCGYGRR